MTKRELIARMNQIITQAELAINQNEIVAKLAKMVISEIWPYKDGNEEAFKNEQVDGKRTG